jgi:DNA (cytosine-5)-methyltransferase 3A
MNVLSLFDGVSCGQIALKKCDIKVENYFASEVDKFTIKVTQNNFPNTIQLGDVRNINISDLPSIDLLIGGSPCQNLSLIGKMKGMSTKDNYDIVTLEQYLELKENEFESEGQSFLFWEYVRILKELKPKFFLLENVKMKNKWENIISEALGVKPIEINSSLVSAQNRRRLYWTNIPNITQPKDKNIFLSDIFEPNPNSKYTLSDKMKLYFKTRKKNFNAGKINYKIGTDKASCITKSSSAIDISDNIIVQNGDYEDLRKLTPLEYERLQTVPDNYTNYVSDTQRYKMLGNGWTVDVIAHILKNIK